MKLALNSQEIDITPLKRDEALQYKSDVVSRMRSIDRDDRNVVSSMSDEDLLQACFTTILESEEEPLSNEGQLCLIALFLAKPATCASLSSALVSDKRLCAYVHPDTYEPFLFDPAQSADISLRIDSTAISFSVDKRKVAMALSLISAGGKGTPQSHHSMVFFHAGRLSAFSAADSQSPRSEAAKVLVTMHALLAQSNCSVSTLHNFFEDGRVDLAFGRSAGQVVRLDEAADIATENLVIAPQKGIH